VKQQTVTLKIAYFAARGTNPPATWDWQTLLDLNPQESVVVIDSTPPSNVAENEPFDALHDD
jgi:hypothetical protein